MMRSTRIRLSLGIAVVVGILLVAAVAAVLTGGLPSSHSRVVGTFDDLSLPERWELSHQHLSGNLSCADVCPTVTRIYWVDGDLVGTYAALVSALAGDAFDVRTLPTEDPGDGFPPRRSLEARRGPVVLTATVIEGTAEAAIDHPPTTVPGRTAGILTLRVETFVDGRYAP